VFGVLTENIWFESGGEYLASIENLVDISEPQFLLRKDK